MMLAIKGSKVSVVLVLFFEKNSTLTHFNILQSSSSGCFAPCCQGVDGHKVWVELTVWVSQHSSQFGNQLSGTILIRSENINTQTEPQTQRVSM